MLAYTDFNIAIPPHIEFPKYAGNARKQHRAKERVQGPTPSSCSLTHRHEVPNQTVTHKPQCLLPALSWQRRSVRIRRERGGHRSSSRYLWRNPRMPLWPQRSVVIFLIRDLTVSSPSYSEVLRGLLRRSVVSFRETAPQLFLFFCPCFRFLKISLSLSKNFQSII